TALPPRLSTRYARLSTPVVCLSSPPRLRRPFFLRAPDHRDPHSFPTRRSSDLRWRLGHSRPSRGTCSPVCHIASLHRTVHRTGLTGQPARRAVVPLDK